MNNLANDIIIDIGKLILKVANENNEEWDYAGYMFETKDGKNSGGEISHLKTQLDKAYHLAEI